MKMLFVCMIISAKGLKAQKVKKAHVKKFCSPRSKAKNLTEEEKETVKERL